MLIPLLAAVALAAAPPAPRSSAGGACVRCHTSWQKLGKDHPAVRGSDIAECLECHPRSTGPSPNRFAARLHRAHAREESCRICHSVGKDGRVRLGKDVVLGRVDDGAARLRAVTASWTASSWLDARHGRHDVWCGACHVADLPDVGADVERQRCLACHGPEEALVQRTAPAVHADRNPHRSHLGTIECTVCHKAHAASEIYCLGCHPKWEMKLPGAK